MAIQVNGTQVIGNSRELTNIASVDATTVAAFGAAGVGGVNATYTADGAISQGVFLNIKSGGLAKAGSASNDTVFSYATASQAATTLYATSGRGCTKYFPDANVFALVGRVGEYGYGQVAVQMVIKNADHSLTVRSHVQVGRNVAQGWAGIADITTDGAGNWCMLYACYNGGSHQWTVNTFTTDSNYNISNMSSPYSLSTGDLYKFAGQIAAYDTNKFCVVRNTDNGVRQVSYHTVARNGTSVSHLSSGTLGSSESAQNGTSPVGLKGFTEPNINANKAVISVKSQSNSSWGGSGVQGLCAATLTFSNNVPSIGARSPVGTLVSSFGTDTFLSPTTYAVHAQDMSSDGTFLAGQHASSATNSNGNVYAFRKASASSDTITKVTTAGLQNFSGAAVYNYGNKTYITYSTSLGTKIIYSVETGLPLRSLPLSGSKAGDFLMNGTSGTTQINAMADIGFLTFQEQSGFASGTKYQFTNVATISGAFGISKAAASSGSSVGVAVLGQVVGGYSNLEVGSAYSSSSPTGSVEKTGGEALGVAISSTELLVAAGSV